MLISRHRSRPRSEQIDRLVWQLAGVLGLDPGPFTLRELLVMGEARSQQAWGHTSALLAMLANVHRDAKKTRPYKPADFNPHLRQPMTSRSPKVGIQALKVFVDQQTQPEA